MFTLPTLSTLVASSTTETSSLVTTFLPIVVWILIIAFVAAGIVFLKKKSVGMVRSVFSTGRRGGKRRRR